MTNTLPPSTRNVTPLRGWLALSPLGVFLCLYLVASLIVGDFYKMPVSVAFVLASIYAVAICSHDDEGRKLDMRGRVDLFSRGAADPGILQMIWIFVLAGAFAASASAIGCIDATVNMALTLMPGSLLPAGLFLGACFISLSIGTSVGTVVALVPVAAGIANATGANAAFIVAIVVGGAFFGDNLSFISDTTIAATRTQGCSMIDKFRANAHIVVPAAVIALFFYIFYGVETGAAQIEVGKVDWLLIVPYLVVLGCSLCGVYVALVLVLGLLSVAIIGLIKSDIGVFGLAESIGNGIAGMGDLIIITLLAGGMLAMIRAQGGIDYILHAMTRHIKGRRGAGFAIAALVSVANLCTANNTIAIITVGPLAADISRRFDVGAKKSASLLDTFSCVVQGMLPYGAQVLMAASLAALSPIAIISNLYYPMTLLVCAILGIVIPRLKKTSSPDSSRDSSRDNSRDR